MTSHRTWIAVDEAAAEATASRPILRVLRPVSETVVEIRRDGQTVGFIETVGPVFVTLEGPRMDVAVEISQSLTIQNAADALA